MFPFRRMDNDEIINAVEEHNKKIDAHNYLAMNLILFPYLADLSSLGKNCRMLDVGSYDGSFLSYLSERGFKNGVGIEPLKKLAVLSRKKGLKVHNSIFVYDRIKKLFKPKSFDIIMFREVFYYFSDIDDTFKCIDYLLKETGFVYVRKHSATSHFYMIPSRKRLYRYGRTAQCLADLGVLRDIFAKRGYSVIKWHKHDSIYIFPLTILNPLIKLIGKEDRFSFLAQKRK